MYETQGSRHANPAETSSTWPRLARGGVYDIYSLVLFLVVGPRDSLVAQNNSSSGTDPDGNPAPRTSTLVPGDRYGMHPSLTPEEETTRRIYRVNTDRSESLAMSTPEGRPKRQAAIKADKKIRQLQELEKSSSEDEEIYAGDEESDMEITPKREKRWRNARSVIQSPSTPNEVHRNNQKPVMDEVDVISSELRSMDITDPRVTEACKQFKQALGSLRQSPIPTMEHSFATCATQASVIQQHSSFHYPVQQPPSQVVMPMGSAAGYQSGVPCYAPQAAPNHPAFTYAQPAMNQQFHPGVQPQQTYYAVPPHHQANFQPTANHQFSQGFPLQQTNYAMPPQQHMMMPGAQHMPSMSEQMAQLIGLQLAAQKKSDLQKASADIQKIPCLTGYEGESTLRDFFNGFEKLSLGLSDAERVELLLSKCKGRARRIGEELQQEVDCNYPLIKKNLSKHILQASTEQSEAMRLLSSNCARNRAETLAAFAERLTCTVKKAYPDSDKRSHERLLNHYFLEGIKDIQLKGIISTMRNLPFEEKVAEAILLENDIHPGRNTSRQHEEQEDYRQRSPQQGIFDVGTSRQHVYGNQGAQRQFQNHHMQEQGHASQGFRQERENVEPRQQNFARQPVATDANRIPIGANQRQGQHLRPTEPPRNNVDYVGSVRVVSEEEMSNITRNNQVREVDCKATEERKYPLLVPTLPITVNGQKLNGLIDTGAPHSFISEKCYAQIAREGNVLKSPAKGRRCLAANGEQVKLLGQSNAEVNYRGRNLTDADFTVAPGTFGHDAIIGVDLLHRLGFKLYDGRNKTFHSFAALSQQPEKKKPKEERRNGRKKGCDRSTEERVNVVSIKAQPRPTQQRKMAKKAERKAPKGKTNFSSGDASSPKIRRPRGTDTHSRRAKTEPSKRRKSKRNGNVRDSNGWNSPSSAETRTYADVTRAPKAKEDAVSQDDEYWSVYTSRRSRKSQRIRGDAVRR